MDERALDKRLALQLAVMVEHQLIGAEHLRPWADRWVLQLEVSPGWLLELCTARDSAEAVRVLSAYAFSPPFESFAPEERTEARVACLLLRHRRGDFPWATLLRRVGETLDAANGRRPCESIYALLTELERHGEDKALEALQRTRLEHEFHEALERIVAVQQLLTAAH